MKKIQLMKVDSDSFARLGGVLGAVQGGFTGATMAVGYRPDAALAVAPMGIIIGVFLGLFLGHLSALLLCGVLNWAMKSKGGPAIYVEESSAM